MKTLIIDLKGESPYSQSAPIQSAKETGEKSDSFEERTWRERMHCDRAGNVFIPPMAIKSCLQEVAKFLGETVPGKGKATYTKHYKAGTLITDPIPLGIHRDKVEGERLFVPSDGVSGSGKRVWKTFPLIPEGWTATASIIVLDPLLLDSIDTMVRHLSHAGKFIGIGRFRPINGGFYGRFSITSHRLED